MKRTRGLGALAAALLAAGCAGGPVFGSSDAGASYADFLIGRVASARQDNDVASDRYYRALLRSPGDAALVDGALVSALRVGDIDRARRIAALAPARGAAAPAYARLVRAADLLVAGRWRQADGEIERVEGGAAEELAARMLSVWTATAEGRVDRVLMDLGPLASIRPYGGLFAYQQAMALDYAGRQEEALEAYRRGAAGGLWLPDGIERHADLLARRGDVDAARALLQSDASRQNPALAAALERLDAGSVVSARPLTPALGAATGLYGLASIFLQESDDANSMAVLSLSMMLDGEADGARISFAQAQSENGRIDLARAMLTRISPTSPYAPAARRLEAWMLLDAGDEEGAFALARENAAADDLRSVRALADMYRNRGRHADAEPLYTRLVDAGANDWRLYFARAASRDRLGRWPEAESDLRRALELSPNQPDVLNYLGYTWIDRGERFEEGLAMIQRAVELRPTSGAIIDSLGWAYFRMGDYERALAYIERAVELTPSDPTLNDHLGDVYWRLDRRIEARFQWRRALTLEPDDAAAIEAKLQSGLPDAPVVRSVER